MKRLLLPLLAALALPTAVNAFPFGKNLQFKTDIGTKILIKGDAVYSEYLTIEDLKKGINNYQMDNFDLYRRQSSYEKEQRKSDLTFLKYYTKGGFLENAKDAEEKRQYWENSVEEHDLALKKFEKEYKERKETADFYFKKLNEEQLIKIQAVNLSFKPVLIDLNNNQTIQSEAKLTCFNPQLSKETKDIWLNYYRYHGGESERELAICKKYAKYK